MNKLYIIGPKKIDTKPKTLKNGKVSIDEKFEMKTQIEFNYDDGKYLSKPVQTEY